MRIASVFEYLCGLKDNLLEPKIKIENTLNEFRKHLLTERRVRLRAGNRLLTKVMAPSLCVRTIERKRRHYMPPPKHTHTTIGWLNKAHSLTFTVLWQVKCRINVETIIEIKNHRNT